MAVATKSKVSTKPGQVTDLAHMIRVLGPESIQAGNVQVTSYDEAQQHLKNAYFDQGWDLYSTELIDKATGQQMGGLRYNTVTMLYVLVKRAD